METPVKAMLNVALTELGFAKERASNWVRHYSEISQVVGLQKSDWGSNYYINLGVWIKALGKGPTPKFHQCHMVRRIDHTALHLNELTMALEEENYWKTDAGERLRIIKLELGNADFVFFSKLQDISAVKQYVLDPNEDKHVGVTRALKEFLEINGDD